MIILMNKEQALQNFGLTESEVNLYVALLKHGEATASELSQKTNTNRTFTYDRLKKLLDNGLVSYVIKDDRKYFKAAEPKYLLSILKEKEEQISSIIPELEKLKIHEKAEPKFELFSSKKGISTVLNIILRERKEVFIHGTVLKFKEIMGSYFEIWNKRRIKENIKVRILTNEEIELDAAEVSLLSEEEISSTTTFIFGNRTVIAIWSDAPIAIVIENEDSAKENKAFFNAIWNREIKIYSNVTGIKRAWMELVSKKSTELVGFGFSWELAQIYGREFSNQWHSRRLKNNIPTRLISYNDGNSKKYFDVRMIEWKDFNITFLKRDICGPACVTMSDNLIVTFLYTEKKFKVILNKNKETIAIYKKHFESLWKISK